MKILLVDDDKDNLRLMQVFLENEQHEIILASNGQEALHKAKVSKPDLVISDILMPVMDGYGLCQAWVKDDALQRVPFIFYTATYQTEEDEAFGLSLGATAFLRKPMEPELFVSQMKQVLIKTSEGTPRPSTPPAIDERTFLRLHNLRLVHKLSQRTQKLAQGRAELSETASRLHLKSAALDAAVNGIVITDRKGNVEWANPAFLTLTGYSWEELREQNLRVIKSGIHDDAFYQEIWETILAGRVWKGEVVNRRKDGTLRTTQTTITPLLDDRGEISHFIDITEDITEQKRVEAELRQSQKMDAVGRLAGGVAHDFNNMLNVILMDAELSLMDENLSPVHRRRLTDIQKAAGRSADLTKQLLAFSRKQLAQPKRINVNEIVLESQKLLHRLIGEDVKLEFTPGPELWGILMDPSQLGQVLANLVINSRDAMPAGGTISIETANIDVVEESLLDKVGLPAGEYVRVTISDTGSGMDPATMEQIFEPFFTTKGEGKGTGLGLSMVYGIVKQNNGAITAYSHLGVGTTMNIYLPHCVDETVEVRTKAEGPMPRGMETLLVAEDEEPMLVAMKSALENLGYTVLAAPNPLEVFLLSQQYQGPIHLLLTDVVMPGMNGRELQDRIHQFRPAIRVLFMSGYTGDIISKRGLLEGDIHFLQKPFSIRDLAKKVRDVLDSP